MTFKKIITIGFIAAALFITAGTGTAHATEEFDLRIKDHKFIPETLEIPAGVKVKINVINEDPTPEEFESYELNREKVIRGNGKGIIFVGPLEAGTYPFFGEFNMDTAQGQLVAK